MSVEIKPINDLFSVSEQISLDDLEILRAYIF